MSPLTDQVIALAAHSHSMQCQRCENFPRQFEYQTLTLQRQTLLEDRLTDLKDLIRGEDGQAVSQDIQILIFRVLVEIESWLKEGVMTFEAQITLSDIAYNDPTKNNIVCNQFPCKV